MIESITEWDDFGCVVFFFFFFYACSFPRNASFNIAGRARIGTQIAACILGTILYLSFENIKVGIV